MTDPDPRTDRHDVSMEEIGTEIKALVATSYNDPTSPKRYKLDIEKLNLDDCYLFLETNNIACPEFDIIKNRYDAVGKYSPSLWVQADSSKLMYQHMWSKVCEYKKEYGRNIFAPSYLYIDYEPYSNRIKEKNGPPIILAEDDAGFSGIRTKELTKNVLQHYRFVSKEFPDNHHMGNGNFVLFNDMANAFRNNGIKLQSVAEINCRFELVKAIDDYRHPYKNHCTTLDDKITFLYQWEYTVFHQQKGKDKPNYGSATWEVEGLFEGCPPWNYFCEATPDTSYNGFHVQDRFKNKNPAVTPSKFNESTLIRENKFNRGTPRSTEQGGSIIKADNKWSTEQIKTIDPKWSKWKVPDHDIVPTSNHKEDTEDEAKERKECWYKFLGEYHNYTQEQQMLIDERKDMVNTNGAPSDNYIPRLQNKERELAFR